MAGLKMSAGVDSVLMPYEPVGDRDQTSRLQRHGGKGGAFVGEIRAALGAGALDVAMHSLKDMPGDEEAPGLVIGAYIKRESPLDALVLRPGIDLAAFATTKGEGLKIGTNAVRRAAYLQRLYPLAEIIHYRGAADTRLKKLDSGALQSLPDGGAVGPADALVMARAGLARIGEGGRIAHVFSVEDMLPAVGQGIVALECRRDDFATRQILAALDDPTSRIEAECEREMLWILNGHCNAPIAGHARRDGERLFFAAAVISLDGRRIVESAAQGTADRPRELGRRVGLDLLAKGAAQVIDDARAAE